MTQTFFYVLEQAVYQDGESVGEPKYKTAWSKVHKNFRARPVAVGKDYSYMRVMVADVLSSVNDTRDSGPTQNSACNGSTGKTIQRTNYLTDTSVFPIQVERFMVKLLPCMF